MISSFQLLEDLPCPMTPKEYEEVICKSEQRDDSFFKFMPTPSSLVKSLEDDIHPKISRRVRRQHSFDNGLVFINHIPRIRRIGGCYMVLRRSRPPPAMVLTR